MARTHKPGRRAGPPRSPEVQHAVDMLRALLADGRWHFLPEIRAKATALGIEERHLIRAGAKVCERGGDRNTVGRWRLKEAP